MTLIPFYGPLIRLHGMLGGPLEHSEATSVLAKRVESTG